MNASKAVVAYVGMPCMLRHGDGRHTVTGCTMQNVQQSCEVAASMIGMFVGLMHVHINTVSVQAVLQHVAHTVVCVSLTLSAVHSVQKFGPPVVE
jgi:hypothetical protein